MISQADIGWQRLSPDIESLVQLLDEAGIPTKMETSMQGRAKVVAIDPGSWGKAAAVAADKHVRWCAVWGEHRPPEIDIFAALAG